MLLLVTVLLTTVVVGLVPASAPTAAGSPSSIRGDAARSPAVTPVTVATLNAGGVPTTDFTAGTAHGTNAVYFSVTDLNRSDSVVNLSVTDPSAARDRLTNPVWTGTVGFTPTDRNNTTNRTGLHFTVPTNLVYGADWSVSATGTSGGTAVAGFTVHTFYLGTSSNPHSGSAVLPGESVTITWMADGTVNGATYASVQGLIVDAWFTANGKFQDLFSSGLHPLAASGLGSLTISVPANATANTVLEWAFWATVNDGSTVTENETVSAILYVGVLAIHIAELVPAPFCTLSSFASQFAVGTTVAVCVQAGASYAGAFSPVPGLSVDLTFWNATRSVTPAGNPPGHLITNSSGEVGATFTATIPPFSNFGAATPNRNHVTLNVTDPLNANQTAGTTSTNLTFYVESAPQAGIVSVTLSQVVYYTGDPVTAVWSVGSTNASGTGPFTPFAWLLYSLPSGSLLAAGNLSSSASSGTLTVPIPTSYSGAFSVEIEAANATTVATGNTSAWVRSPEILVTASESYYLPGTTLTFTVTTAGGAVLTGSTLYYDAWAFFSTAGGAPLGQSLVANGTIVNGGDLLIPVPSNAAPTEYTVEVWAQSPTFGLYASSGTSVDEAAGYQVLVGVPTPPTNADGTYAPGETIVVSYAISTYGVLPLSKTYSVDLGIYGTSAQDVLQTTSSSGNVSLAIPSDQPAGAMEIFAYVYGTGLTGANCNSNQCVGYTWIPVNPHPAVAPPPSHDLGFTTAWYILLGIVVAMGLLLYLALRGRGPPRMPNEPSETELMPPAPAPREPAPTEWKEPESTPPGESEPPPLPNRPPGAD